MAGGRTGQVFLEDFDVGLVRSFGAELMEIELDGEKVQDYVLKVDGVTGPDPYRGMIPVIFMNPEDVYQPDLLPQIVVSRSAVTPAPTRWFPGGREYRVPAATAKTVTGSNGQRGPTLVEVKAWTPPFDIQYDVHLRARLQGQAQRMLRKVGRVLWFYGQIFVKDSEGEERGYHAFAESIDNLDEIAEVSERMVGNSISVRIEGELDFFDPMLARTMTRLSTKVMPASSLVGG